MTTATRQTARSARNRAVAGKPAFLPPIGPRRPTHHNGSMIVREELIMHRPNAPFKLSKIHLENASVAYACRDCVFTADARGRVMVHRNQEHGARYGQKKPKVELTSLAEAPDLVLPPREDGEAAPSDPMKWTIEELFRLLPSISALGDLIDHAQEAADEALAQLGDQRKNQAKIDGYDELRDQLTEAKQQMRQMGDYDQLKAEVVKLRAWKRKTITRLKGAGFVFTADEEQ